MYKKVFLDANVFIDLFDEKRDTKKNAFHTFDYLTNNDIEIYTSCDLITTIYYILSKTSKELALSNIEKTNKICKVIEFSNQEVLETCTLMRENQKFKDLEDTIQYILAKKEGCDLIISNDKNFVSDEIGLLTTQEFLEKIR
ncbi:MAG: PIN domain-containing protein [Campylobacterota bacterium]|nr:PIN domain-containing protein [Campylobacterota bacterium]